MTNRALADEHGLVRPRQNRAGEKPICELHRSAKNGIPERNGTDVLDDDDRLTEPTGGQECGEARQIKRIVDQNGIGGLDLAHDAPKGGRGKDGVWNTGEALGDVAGGERNRAQSRLDI